MTQPRTDLGWSARSWIADDEIFAGRRAKSFTQNHFAAAPVLLSKAHLKKSAGLVRALKAMAVDDVRLELTLGDGKRSSAQAASAPAATSGTHNPGGVTSPPTPKLARARYPDGLPYAVDAKAALTAAQHQLRLPLATTTSPDRLIS